MPEYAMSYTPDVVIDEATGQEHIDYENGVITSSGQRRQIMDDVSREVQDSYVVTEDGDLESHLDFNDDDAGVLMERHGGEERFTQALQWAGENLSEEMIEEFDYVMANGNIAEVDEYIGMLMEVYDDAEGESQELNDFQEYFFSQVMSEETFEQVADYMRENFDQRFIDQTNEFIDNADYDNYMRNIQTVIERIQNEQ